MQDKSGSKCEGACGVLNEHTSNRDQPPAPLYHWPIPVAASTHRVPLPYHATRSLLRFAVAAAARGFGKPTRGFGKPTPGRPRYLTPEQDRQVRQWLAHKPTAHGFPTDL